MSQGISPTPVVVKIPRYLNVDSFEKTFLKKYRREVRKKTPQVIFDFSETLFTDLMELMSVAVAAEHVKQLSQASISFIFPDAADSAGFRKFVQVWRFIEYLERFSIKTNIKQESTYSTDRLLPVTDLSDVSLSDLTRELRRRIIYYFSELPISQVESLVDGIVFEVAENAASHAYESSADVAVCRCISARRVPNAGKGLQAFTDSYWLRMMATLYPDKDFLEIAVVDGGVGVYKRLYPAFERFVRSRLPSGRDPLPAEVSQAECLQWALSKNRSSHLASARRGFGLFRVVSYAVDGWKGAFYIRSGTARVVHLPNEDFHVRNDLSDFPGTQIRVFLPILRREKEIDEVTTRVASVLGETI